MRVHVEILAQGVVITLDGEVDLLGTDEVRDALLVAVDHHGPVVLDLRAVAFLDMVTARIVADGSRLFSYQGRRCVIASAAGPVRRVLELVAPEHGLAYRDSLAAAWVEAATGPPVPPSCAR